MYSVMLAAMLTTTSATPDWGSCHGCCGGAFCHGYSCSGWNMCHGCCGGCYGCRGYNAFSPSCWASCYCHGSSCGGCSGCCGGCSGCYGCYGCCGGAVYYSSCSGCCGGCCGGVTVTPAGGSMSASEKAMQEQIRKLQEENQKLKGGKPKSEEVSEPAPAHVVVKLPGDARLFVDETPCPLTSATRAFDTPDLQPGQTYYYTLRAEAMRDGLPVKESKRVTLRAGRETVVEFGDMQTVQAARR